MNLPLISGRNVTFVVDFVEAETFSLPVLDGDVGTGLDVRVEPSTVVSTC